MLFKFIKKEKREKRNKQTNIIPYIKHIYSSKYKIPLEILETIDINK